MSASDVLLAQATLELDLATASPVGSLLPSDGGPLRFAGWLEFAQAVERWRLRERERHSGGGRDPGVRHDGG